MLNLSPLFHTTIDSETCLHDKLDLTLTQRALIDNARKEIRDCLRTGIPRVLQTGGYTGKVPEPRFFTQGSWAYKTLNVPPKERQPPQQADMDDGCYLPLSFVSQPQRPSAAAKVFFSAAEGALEPLVAEKGWHLVTNKPTCVRVVISTFAHIDIPLYAIPDVEFAALTASMERHGYDAVFAEATQDTWEALPTDKVLLAHRENDWIRSDPRPVKDWFEGEVEARGEQLRRVVRYLKAFRDWQWRKGGPASILLMAAAAPVFEKHKQRDDLALLEVVAQLPSRLRAGVNNPVDASESLTKRLGDAEVEEAARAFEDLGNVLRAAIVASNTSQVCIWMRKEFGPRFPDEPDRIKPVSVAVTITAAPAAIGPSELIGRTKAG